MFPKITSKIATPKTITSISEIPLSFKVSTLFGVTGFISGSILVIIPKKYIQTEICLPFPHISDNEFDYKLMACFLLCSTCYGYIGGKMYQYKTFKLGDAKRFYKVLNNLVHKTPIAVTHGAGFPLIVYYGMFGMFTLFETLIYGQPYGYRHSLNEKQTLLERAKFALEITAHWTESTIFIVLPIFLCSSCTLFITHRSYWLRLFMRLKKP